MRTVSVCLRCLFFNINNGRSNKRHCSRMWSDSPWVVWKAREKRGGKILGGPCTCTNARHTAAIWLVEKYLARNSNLFGCTSVCSSLRSFVRTAALLKTWLLSSKNIWFIHRTVFPNPWLIFGGTKDFFPTWQEPRMIPFHWWTRRIVTASRAVAFLQIPRLLLTTMTCFRTRHLLFPGSYFYLQGMKILTVAPALCNCPWSKDYVYFASRVWLAIPNFGRSSLFTVD